MRILNPLLLLFAFCSLNSIAQDMPVEDLPTATLNEDFYLTLNPEAPVSAYYYVDISHLDFVDEADVTKKCRYYLTANLITPEVHFSENYLIVQIHTEFMTDDWDYEKVQTYLNQLTKPL